MFKVYKSIIIFLLSLMLCISFFACGTPNGSIDDNKPSTPYPPPAEEIVDPSEPDMPSEPSKPVEPAEPIQPSEDDEKFVYYTIYYDLGEFSRDKSVTIDSKTQRIKYKSQYQLLTPNVPANKPRFLKWIIVGTTEEFTNGIYNLEKDTYLVAIYENIWSPRV